MSTAAVPALKPGTRFYLVCCDDPIFSEIKERAASCGLIYTADETQVDVIVVSDFPLDADSNRLWRNFAKQRGIACIDEEQFGVGLALLQLAEPVDVNELLRAMPIPLRGNELF